MKVWRRKREEWKKEESRLVTCTDRGCSSRSIEKQIKPIILKEDNKGKIEFERKGFLSFDDEVETTLSDEDLEDDFPSILFWSTYLQKSGSRSR